MTTELIVILLSGIALAVAVVAITLLFVWRPSPQLKRDMTFDSRGPNEPGEPEELEEPTKGKLYVEIMGGLGNQLFQLVVAERYGASAYVPDPSRVTGMTQRVYHHELLDNIVPCVGVLPQSCQHVQEQQEFHYHPPLSENSAQGNIVLHGYFQHPAYNMNLDVWSPRIQRWYPVDHPEHTVAVHVRRGDYVDLGFNLDASYYVRAMEYMTSVYPEATFLMFSDDPAWCRTVFPDVKIAERKQDYQDLSSMAQCDGLIMSNSTFSWWAAAALPENKPVVAPREWKIGKPPSDFWLPHWVRI